MLSEDFVLDNPEMYQPIYDDDYNYIGYDVIFPREEEGKNEPK